MPKKNLNVLAIETSSPKLSIALKKGRQEIAEVKLSGYSSHDRHLIPLIARLLKKNRLSIDKIDVFLIDRGPGSFTGLRVGFATLKALMALKRKTCYAAQSLDMIAETIDRADGTRLAVCLDARREKIYFRLYRRVRGRWISQNRTSILFPAEILPRLPAGAVVAGDALIRYGDYFRDWRPSSIPGKFAAHPPFKIRIAPSRHWYPKASALIRLFEKNDPKLFRLTRGAHFLPLYFRPSGAEERKRHHAART